MCIPMCVADHQSVTRLRGETGRGHTTQRLLSTGVDDLLTLRRFPLLIRPDVAICLIRGS